MNLKTYTRLLAREVWLLSSEGASARHCEEVEELVMDATWPVDRTINKAKLREASQVTAALPFALAQEAMADGFSGADVLRAFADGLDPQP